MAVSKGVVSVGSVTNNLKSQPTVTKVADLVVVDGKLVPNEHAVNPGVIR